MSLLNDSVNGLTTSRPVLEKYARSVLGFDYQDMKDNALNTAILDPKTYILKRNEAKHVIEKNLTTLYASTFTDLIEKNYPEHLARDLALKTAKEASGLQYRLLEDQYPNLFTGIAANLESKKTLINDNPILSSRPIRRKSHHKKKRSKKHK